MMSSMSKKRCIKPILCSLVIFQHKISQSLVLHNQMKNWTLL